MKRIALALLLSVLLVCSFGLEVCAETVVKDGIEVTLTTDKESYDALDVIDARLTVRNTNEFAVENVSAQITAPEGYALSGSDEVKIGELSAGEAQIQQVDVRNEAAVVPALPETGDDSYVVLWGILFAGSAVLCAVVIRNPKAKRIVSLFLCIAMTGTMVLEAMPVVAEKQDRRIAVSKQVDVGGKLVTITGTVDYSIEADLAENEESKVTEKIQNTYGYSDGGDNSSQAGWGEVSPMLFAITTAEELKRIAFMDVSYVGFRGNRHTFSWQGGYSDTYIVNVKILDGSPAYTDDEAGTSIVQNKRQSENSIQFVVPADILNGTYIKVHVYGETDGQQTESGNQIYMQIGGDCEHPWMDRISNYDTVYIPVDEEEHQIAGHSYSYCGNCGVLIYEEITPSSGNQEHSFSNNTNMCTRCGYKQELACDHDFISVPGQRYSLVFPLLDENPTYHQISVGYTLACSKCGEETSSYVSGMDEHEFNSENECICGYALDVSCEHQAPEREQVGDTVYEQYSPQIGDYSQFFHMAINTYRTKCSVCGIVSEETTDEIETENHVYDENRICIYCGDEARTEGGISAPELSDIVSSAGDTVNSGSKSTFSTTIRDDRVLSYIGVYFDGILQEEYINPPILADESFELAWTCLFSKRLGDQHVITFAACDSDGNWAEKEYTITVVCDHENVETQDWGYKNEKIEGNDKIHHVVSTKITKCLECSEEIDREVTKGTEAHKFVDMYCTLCGYDISGCLHDTCKDEYNPDIPIQYKDNGDGKTHTWQNGYDCTCLTCGRVTQVYGEEQIAEHDYSTGNVCPCGFDVVPPCSGRFDFSRDPISGDASDINNVILNFEAGSAITFTLGAGDNVQLAKLELFRDGVLVNQMDCNVNYGELTYTTEELTPGKFVLKLVATDAVGLTTTFIFNINVIGSDCTHELCTDYENGEIKYVEKDASSHYYQLGYDRICDNCSETWQVYSDLSEDMVAPHDYTNGDTCLCGYDRSDCEHESDGGYTYLRDEIEQIPGNATHHRVMAYVYETTCILCKVKYEVESSDGGVGRPAAPHDEDKHVFEDGVCGTCGYECTHAFETMTDADGNPKAEPNSGVWASQGEQGHKCTSIKYWQKCTNCGLEETYEKTNPYGDEVQEHMLNALVSTGYNYSETEHWIVGYKMRCTALGCGYEKFVEVDNAVHDPHQFYSGYCTVCGRATPYYSDGSSGSASNASGLSKDGQMLLNNLKKYENQLPKESFYYFDELHYDKFIGAYLEDELTQQIWDEGGVEGKIIAIGGAAYVLGMNTQAGLQGALGGLSNVITGAVSGVVDLVTQSGMTEEEKKQKKTADEILAILKDKSEEIKDSDHEAVSISETANEHGNALIGWAKLLVGTFEQGFSFKDTEVLEAVHEALKGSRNIGNTSKVSSLYNFYSGIKVKLRGAEIPLTEIFGFTTEADAEAGKAFKSMMQRIKKTDDLGKLTTEMGKIQDSYNGKKWSLDALGGGSGKFEFDKFGMTADTVLGFINLYVETQSMNMIYDDWYGAVESKLNDLDPESEAYKAIEEVLNSIYKYDGNLELGEIGSLVLEGGQIVGNAAVATAISGGIKAVSFPATIVVEGALLASAIGNVDEKASALFDLPDYIEDYRLKREEYVRAINNYMQNPTNDGYFEVVEKANDLYWATELADNCALRYQRAVDDTLWINNGNFEVFQKIPEYEKYQNRIDTELKQTRDYFEKLGIEVTSINAL